MTAPSISIPETGVEARLRSSRIRPDVAVAIVGCLAVLVTDTQGLSLIPLITKLETEYSFSPTQASWALASITVVAAVAVPTLTRLGDRVGMRRLVLIGLLLGVVGNIISAVSVGFLPFLLGRAIMGFSAAGPLIYAILRVRSGSEKATARGVGIITIAAGVGVAIAYLLSGFIIQANGSVRAVFWAMAILAAITLLVGWFILPDSPIRMTKRIDVVGAVLLAIALTAVVLAVSEGGTWGWTSPIVLGLLVGSVVVVVLWVLWERRHADPLINVRIAFTRVATPAYIVTGIAGSLAIFGNLAQAVYLESPAHVVGYGLSATVLECAYYLCAIAVFVMIGGFVAGPVISKLGSRGTMVISGLFIAGDFFFMAAFHTLPWHFILGNSVWGFFFALAYSASNAAYLEAARPDQSAMFSAANFIVGAAISGIGPGLFTAVLTAGLTPKAPVPAPGVFSTLWIMAAVGGLLIVVLALISKRAAFTNDLSADVTGGH